MNVITRATVLTKMTKWIMVFVITNMTMMTMSITPIRRTRMILVEGEVVGKVGDLCGILLQKKC